MNIFKKDITDAQVDQLLEYTKSDPQIAKWTSDLKRFKDKFATKKWLKNCTVYTLIGEKDNLLGIIWFDPHGLPKAEYTQKVNPQDFPVTFAIRLYGSARGKGLAFDFAKKAFEDFGGVIGVWIRTSLDNFGARSTFQKFGFKQISKPDLEGKILLIVNSNSG